MQDDLAVIAIPSYGGRVPALAAERLAKINGNQAGCVVICVYGNQIYEDTLLELSDIAEQSNFKVIAAGSAIAEHSIMHQYATDRPNREDKDELRSFAGKDKCVRCGLCAERCPAQAISKENIKMIMKDRRFAFH